MCKGSVCSDEGLMLETSAKHHIPQAKNILYQPLLIKPIFSILAHAEKQFFSKLVFQYDKNSPTYLIYMYYTDKSKVMNTDISNS